MRELNHRSEERARGRAGAEERWAIGCAGLLVAGWVGMHLDVPLTEDGMFWWVPKSLWVAEQGPAFVLDSLPEQLDRRSLPPQWEHGLPDYGHPPLWYAWLGLFLWVQPTVQAVHLAVMVPAVLAAVGFVRLGAILGSPWAGLAVLALPPVLAQWLRCDLDVPLLAVIPWALVALLQRRWVSFALLGVMAPWLKEPGVLLAAPAVWVALEDRQLRIAALAPVFGLASWALVRGGLARPERLPSSWLAYLSDLGDVVHILVVDQGRWLLLAGLLVAWVVTRKMGRELARPRVRAPWAILVVFVGTWGLFFAAVGFFANRGALEAHTHVRYLLPAMAVLAVSLAARVPRNWIPVLVLPGLFWLHERSTYGPEASCFGVDAAIAEQEAASWIAEQDHPVWVGTYQSVGLTQPWVGIVDRPVEGLHVYRYGTDPESIGSGSIVVKAAYGEPTGTIERGIRLSELRRWTHHEATVVAWKVR